MRVDVIYAANVQPGDRVAGEVNPSAPTRPVQPFAAALTVHQVSEVPAAGYTFHYSDDPSSGLMSRAHKGSELIMVIRD